MTRRRWALAAVAAILLALPAGWYWASPWWTLWRIREAARAGDLAELAAYVDSAAVEAQAKAELKRSWGSVETAIRSEGEGGRRFADLARRKLAEAGRSSFRPAEIREWLAGIEIFGGGRGDPYVVRRGLDSFELRYRASSLDNGPVLSFRRHGLGWKLAGVRWGRQ